MALLPLVVIITIGSCFAADVEGLAVSAPAPGVNAADDFSEEEIHFRSGDVTLSGTVLVPKRAGLHPAIALVHGSGPGPRELNRREAEAFAREGIVTLIYDKRTKDYSMLERSYELLGNDALAAVRTLQARPEVDPAMVGLWGLSEGTWVAEIAASRSGEVAFLVLVGPSGVPPAQQEAWRLENVLHHHGIAGSMIRTVTRTWISLLVAADMFPEATHDPVPVLETLQQPILALWGEHEQSSPPAESARIIREALERGGNHRYTIRFIPNADHELHVSPDGFTRRETFAPGYVDTVTSWVKGVARGETPSPSTSVPPLQQRLSPDTVIQIPWYESGGWLQLIAFLLLALGFASYPVAAFVCWLRQRRSHRARSATGRLAAWLACTGLVAVLGLFGYLSFLIISPENELGFVIAGRPLPWLALQALALTTVVLSVLLASHWWLARHKTSRWEGVHIGILLDCCVVFVVWGVYWGLLVP